MIPAFLTARAAQPFRMEEVPLLTAETFRAGIVAAVRDGRRISSLFARPLPEAMELWCVLADDRTGTLHIARARVRDAFASLAAECPQAQAFEREIAEQWDLVPEGHPWLKPLRYHAPRRAARGLWGRAAGRPIVPGVTDFFRVEGDAVHEVAVGPVHAGVIEPGHFRFQCLGEEVLHLEIALGYQHRGVEQALVEGDPRRAAHYAETLAGDTSIGHALAWAETIEALGAVEVPARAHALRAVALELERMANHTGDLGALAGDVGFLPTQAYCGRIRGDFLNMTALLCGNRFGRNLVRPGGVCFDLEPPRAAELRRRLAAADRDARGAVDLLFTAPSVLGRFEETGRLDASACERLGLVGPAARACGATRDVRHDHPTGGYRDRPIAPSTSDTGDVLARALVRRAELHRSIAFALETIDGLPPGPIRVDAPGPAAGCGAVSLVEGWRGEICHVSLGAGDGAAPVYKVVDPSFHNWPGLADAMRGQAISDFPLCNKSFNLSYCGHDL